MAIENFAAETPVSITAQLKDHQQVVSTLHSLIPVIEEIATRLTECLQNGGTIFWMGNGGSAADAQHLAAELVVRFTRNRKALPSLALTTDTSILTAAANDFSFDMVFSRQIEALCSPHDAVVGISTSGTSPNIIAGLEIAREIGAYTVGFTGARGESLRKCVDSCLIVDSAVTARIQEAHTLVGHILCDWIEYAIASYGE